MISDSDIPLVTTAVVLLISYHVFLTLVANKFPHRTVIGITRQARRMWIKHILRKKDYILAVQTFRNTVTSCSILSSVTVTLSVAMVKILTSFYL
jgi:hypothetical protein